MNWAPVKQKPVAEEKPLTDEELHNALHRLHAYDLGCVDSGICDPILKERAKKRLEDMDTDERRLFLSHSIREEYLTDEALEEGYGLEDVEAFMKWMDDEGFYK